MISPYVRRIRLGRELLALRQEAGQTSEHVARTSGLPRATVSRLENGKARPDQADVLKLLDHFGVTGQRWQHLTQIAREAAERGWWAAYTRGGARQALYANLEAGAAQVREYQMTLLPGLLQLPDFARAGAEEAVAAWSLDLDVDKTVEARSRRQQIMHRDDGPSYEVIIDALAVWRAAAPPSLIAQQLRHIIDAAQNPRIDVYVLPLDVMVLGQSTPSGTFSLYRYPDPLDPTVVAVDTVTDDLVITVEPVVAQYVTLYERLLTAALDVDDTAAFLAEAAERNDHRAKETA